MKNGVSEPLARYEAHYETLRGRVGRRLSPTNEMDWLFHGSNTLCPVPDYLEFHAAGHNPTERRINHSLFRASRGLWFRLLWPKIRQGLMSYMRDTYFPIFLQKSAQTPGIEEYQGKALEAVESFLDRPWDNLGLCTFYEVGVLVNEVLNSCHGFLGCPADLFAPDKHWQNQESLGLVKKYASDLASHPKRLEILAYAACQSNWFDSLEGEAAQLPQIMEKNLNRMISDPASLNQLAEGNPCYQIGRFVQIVSGEPKNILFECDNCGEVVFDLMLIQHLVETGHNVVLGAKASPALNDATVQDVEGLLSEAPFAPLGPALKDGRLSLLAIESVMGGKLAYEASEAYKQAYESADFLLLKGQGNLQSLPMGVRRGGRFIPYPYKKPLVFFLPVKSVMSRLCLDAIMSPRPPDRSLFLYCFDPSDPTTYP